MLYMASGISPVAPKGIARVVPLHLYPCDVKPHMKFLQKSHHGKLLMYVWIYREEKKEGKVERERERERISSE